MRAVTIPRAGLCLCPCTHHLLSASQLPLHCTGSRHPRTTSCSDGHMGRGTEGSRSPWLASVPASRWGLRTSVDLPQPSCREKAKVFGKARPGILGGGIQPGGALFPHGLALTGPGLSRVLWSLGLTQCSK